MPLLDLSLCMIVKNEELHLDRCLSSVQGIVSEIIIADTGSTDLSLSIAKRYGAHLIHLPWENDFAKSRNVALREASCSWILVLDADEELDEWKPDEILPLLQDENVNGYYLQIVNFLNDLPEREFVSDAACRLFRNDRRIQFRGKVHEDVSHSIIELSNASIPFSSLRINHFGYMEREIVRKEKNSRNFNIIAQALIEQPEDPMLNYALGTEYYQTECYEQALTLFIPLIKKLPNNTGYLSDLYMKTAYALHMTQQLDEAERLLDQGISLFPDFSDLHEAKAFLLMEQLDNSKAYEALQLALKSGDTSYKYTSTSGSGTYRTHTLAGYLCEKLWFFQEALEHYFQAMTLKPSYFQAWSKCISLCLLSGQTQRLAEHLKKNVSLLTPRHIALLTPAFLNARCLECLEPMLAVALPDGQALLLRSIYIWLLNDRSEAVRTLNQLHMNNDSDPLPLSYLWAIALAQSDGITARKVLEVTSANNLLSPLVEIQELLDKGAIKTIRETSLIHAMQFLTQVGAWETIFRIYQLSMGYFPWSQMPQSLLCGLLKAPANVKQQWISFFAANHLATDSIHATDAVFFAIMAQTCGETLSTAWMQEMLQKYPNNRAVTVLVAYHYLDMGRRQEPGLPAGSLEPELLLRAFLKEA
ncbi:hypothetical protein BC351_14800 [Paenibacillus ferrarius]|uniref:Glycosyltransferase 2-like domain-containing protein n=1 Tax=Paenibacillus ferrarius TaxID=1469647 RepID=A0A1V4HRP7_9BACL|nr:glycosyltransferase [Paenibacillus ferrarius]OPH61212.1 hypothetical protein BC351_14800 [Paenibacillus ferrarius]